jgi:NodT family efflux transporter outer membrane factor (OMF) lipoprotein
LHRKWIGACLVALQALSCGCTPLVDYVHNGFKVGPNYGRPPAPVANNWIDGDDIRIRKESDDLSKWWTVFNDPVLDSLICMAYRQNLTLREAGFRVLQARAQLGIEVGNLFPQTQQMNGDYTRNALSREIANGQISNNQGTVARQRWFGQWDYGFNLSWEIDFWGRLRRSIESGLATLDASVDDYDDVLVTLLGDVATNYTQIRTLEQRIQFAQQNIELQRKTLGIVEGRFKAGIAGTTKLDVYQAKSTLEQTEAQIPELEISLRQTSNQLCILLGIPPEDLQKRIGAGAIPTAPTSVAAGIPADLLRRRPDVRRAERQAAAQCAQIGVADAEFYPRIALNGTFGWSAEHINKLFREQAFRGDFGPAFQWNILNYGRLRNNVRSQDAHFQELIAAYQNSVLNAGRDVENGLVTFLRAQKRVKSQADSVEDQQQAVNIALKQYELGTADLTRVTLLQQTLVQQQDTLAQAQGEIVTGLITVYRALGGGWQIRIDGCDATLPPGQHMPPASDEDRAPAPRPILPSMSRVPEENPAVVKMSVKSR